VLMLHMKYWPKPLAKFGCLNFVLPVPCMCRLTLVPSVAAGLQMSPWTMGGLWGHSPNCCSGCHNNNEVGFGGQEPDKLCHLIRSQLWILVILCMGPIGSDAKFDYYWHNPLIHFNVGYLIVLYSEGVMLSNMLSTANQMYLSLGVL
jgi:hypothetical protein